MTLRTTRWKLAQLTDAARDLAKQASDKHMVATSRKARRVVATLIGATAQLDTDGLDYLDAAEAFAEAGAESLADIACEVGRCAHARS